MVTLQVARHADARGTGGDEHVSRRVAARLGQHALLELDLLRDVLLDEVHLPRHGQHVGGEGELPLGRQRRAGEPRERPFGVRDRAADPFLHFGFDVGGHHVDAEMQCARRPAAADHSRAQKPQRPNLSHRYHPIHPGKPPERCGIQRADLFNVVVII